MVRLSLPSLEAVYVEMYRGDVKLSSGTGIICDTPGGPVLISNWHNFSGRNNQTGLCLSPTLAEPNLVRCYLRRVDDPGRCMPVDFALLDDNDAPKWVEHPVFGRKVDVAGLRIVPPSSTQVYPVSWRNPIPLGQRVGIPAKVVGYPFGMRINQHLPVWTTGHIASEPDVDVDDLPLMLIDCRTRRGQSGSPVLLHYPRGMMYTHEDGQASVSDADVSRMLGIYSGRISIGSDVGLVWKLSAVAEILQASG